jgi:predicted RNA methylase
MEKIMATNDSLESALLISQNPNLRARFRLKHGKAPLICLDTISKAAIYQKCFKDADIIFIDTALLECGASKVVEEILGYIKHDTVIIYLVTSLNELRRVALTPYQRFKMLNQVL